MKIREDGENMFTINRLFCEIFLNRFKRKNFVVPTVLNSETTSMILFIINKKYFKNFKNFKFDVRA